MLGPVLTRCVGHGRRFASEYAKGTSRGGPGGPFIGHLMKFERRPTPTAPENVQFSVRGSAGCVQLNRTEFKNRLDGSMVNRLTDQLTLWEEDDEVAFYIMSSASQDVFSAGVDLTVLAEAGKAGNEVDAMEFLAEQCRLCYLIHGLRKPMFSIVDGEWSGGLALNGQYRVGTEKTVFSVPEPAFGYFPDAGVCKALLEMPHRFGLFLVLTGQQLRGRDVLRGKLVTHFVNSNHVELLKADLETIQDRGPAAARKALDIVQEHGHQSIVFGREAPSVLIENATKVERLFSWPSLEYICELLQGSGDAWWSEQAALMRSRCPLSQAAVWKRMHTSSECSLRQVLGDDYKLAHYFVSHPDFLEGVRAAFVDEGVQPKWTTSGQSFNELNRFLSSPRDLHGDWKPQNSIPSSGDI